MKTLCHLINFVNVLGLTIDSHLTLRNVFKTYPFLQFHFLLSRNFGNRDIIVNRVLFQRALHSSLRKQLTFGDASNGFPAK